jgi:hypothetical protein
MINVADAINGRDYLSNEDLSTGERVERGIQGVVTWASTSVALAELTTGASLFGPGKAPKPSSPAAAARVPQTGVPPVVEPLIPKPAPALDVPQAPKPPVSAPSGGNSAIRSTPGGELVNGGRPTIGGGGLQEGQVFAPGGNTTICEGAPAGGSGSRVAGGRAGPQVSSPASQPQGPVLQGVGAGTGGTPKAMASADQPLGPASGGGAGRPVGPLNEPNAAGGGAGNLVPGGSSAVPPSAPGGETQARQAAWGQQLENITGLLERLGRRALRESTRPPTRDWKGYKSAELLERYAQIIQNRLARTNAPYRLVLEPAAMPGTMQRVPTRWMRNADGRMVPVSAKGSRRADIGVIDLRTLPQGADPFLHKIVAGMDITQKGFPANPGATWRNPKSYNKNFEKPADIVDYYREAFGIDIMDVRRGGDWRGGVWISR